MRFAGGLARDLRRRGVDLGEFVVQPLRGELQSGRAVGIGLYDLGAGFDVFAVDGEHDLGAGKVQFVITAIDVNALGIDHRAHGAVEDADTVFLNEFAELVHKISGNSVPLAVLIKQRPRA
jgi:hypothetical protein